MNISRYLRMNQRQFTFLVIQNEIIEALGTNYNNAVVYEATDSYNKKTQLCLARSLLISEELSSTSIGKLRLIRMHRM